MPNQTILGIQEPIATFLLTKAHIVGNDFIPNLARQTSLQWMHWYCIWIQLIAIESTIISDLTSAAHGIVYSFLLLVGTKRLSSKSWFDIAYSFQNHKQLTKATSPCFHYLPQAAFLKNKHKQFLPNSFVLLEKTEPSQLSYTKPTWEYFVW